MLKAMFNNILNQVKETKNSKDGASKNLLESSSTSKALALPKNEFAFIFDQSGSMYGDEEVLQKCLPPFLKQLSALSNNVRITLIFFDHEFSPKLLRVTPGQIKPVEYQALGSTALLDAYCSTINYIYDEQEKEREAFEVAEREKAAKDPKYSMNKYFRPETYIFTVTDGEENSSSLFNWEDTSLLTNKAMNEYGYNIFYFCTSTHNLDALPGQYGIEESNIIPMLPSDDCYENLLTLYSGLSKHVSEKGKLIGTIHEFAKDRGIPLPTLEEIKKYNELLAEVGEIETKVSELEKVAYEFGATAEFYELRTEIETEYLIKFSEIIENCEDVGLIAVLTKTYNRLSGQVKHSEALCHYVPAKKMISANLIRVSVLEDALLEFNKAYDKLLKAAIDGKISLSRRLEIYLESFNFAKFKTIIDAYLINHDESSELFKPIRECAEKQEVGDKFVENNYLTPLHDTRSNQYSRLRASFETILKERKSLLIAVQYEGKYQLSESEMVKAAETLCFDSSYIEWLRATFKYLEDDLFSPFNNVHNQAKRPDILVSVPYVEEKEAETI